LRFAYIHTHIYIYIYIYIYIERERERERERFIDYSVITRDTLRCFGICARYVQNCKRFEDRKTKREKEREREREREVIKCDDKDQ